MALTKIERRFRIKKRIRKIVKGTAVKPRMSVFRSNTQIYVQLIDDESGKTLVAASSRCKEIAGQKVNKTEQAALVGKLIDRRRHQLGRIRQKWLFVSRESQIAGRCSQRRRAQILRRYVSKYS